MLRWAGRAAPFIFQPSSPLPLFVIPAPFIRHPRGSGDPWHPSNFLDSHFRGNDKGASGNDGLGVGNALEPLIRHPRPPISVTPRPPYSSSLLPLIVIPAPLIRHPHTLYTSPHTPLIRHPPQTLYVSSPHLSRHPHTHIRHPRESGDPWRPNNFLDSHFRGNDKEASRNDKEASRNDKEASRNDKGASGNDKEASRNDKGASGNDKGVSGNDKGVSGNGGLPNGFPVGAENDGLRVGFPLSWE